MPEPEVIREEAERLSLACNYEPAVSLARTVVALYDRLDLVRGAKASEVEAIWIEQVEAMRECIDRLRSGWYAAEDEDGDLWWWRDDPEDRGVECELMTDAQRAVME